MCRNGVYIKKKLETTNFGKYGLLFYNSIFIIMPGLIVAELTGDIDKVLLIHFLKQYTQYFLIASIFIYFYYFFAYFKAVSFENWNNYLFVAAFLASCFLGFVLNVSMVLCTHVNSALTTMVVGCLKDILLTYAGMFVGGDYVFDWINFIGLNIW